MLQTASNYILRCLPFNYISSDGYRCAHTHPEQFWELRNSLPFQLFPWRINNNIKLLQPEHAEGNKGFNTEGGRVCCELLLPKCKFYSVDHDAKKEKKPTNGIKREKISKQNPEEFQFPFTGEKTSVKNGPILMPRLQADMTESAHLISLIKSWCTWHTQVESRYFILASAQMAKLIQGK